MGTCYFNIKDYSQADKYYDEALLINPNLLEVLSGKAKILEEEKNYNRAIDLYNELIDKYPYDENILYKKGLCLEKMEQYKDAIKTFDQSLIINNTNIDCLYHKGYCFDRLGTKREAMKCFNEVINYKNNKYVEECLLLKAKILLDEERYDEALKELNGILRLYPKNNAAIYFYIGYINSKKGEHQEAINNYLKCIEINDKDKIFYYNLGLSYLEINNLEQSLDYLNKSFELDNSFIPGLLKSGEVLLKLKRYDESILVFDKILNNEKENNNKLALLRKGDALFMKQSFEEALKNYEKVLALDEENEEALIGAGICKRKLMEIDEAINYYDKALEMNYDNVNIIYNKAIALSFKENNDEANNLLIKAKNIKESEDIYFSLLLNNLNDKKYSQVNEIFDNYIKNNNKITNPGIYNIKAQTLYEEEKYEEALNYVEKALEINPDYNYAFNTKANILDKLGKKEEALIWYQKAAESKPENIIFLMNYCLSLLENKSKQKSKEIFDKIKSLYDSKQNDLYNKQEINFIETNIKNLDDKFKKIKI